jgi:hypothetical protein
MFGLSLKDKSKKVLNEHFKMEGGWTPSWLNSLVSQGKNQGYNEYDVAIYYKLNSMEWLINVWKDHETASAEEKQKIYKGIHEDISLIYEIQHLAHADTDFLERLSQIVKKSEILHK